jgi:hypothetical protein
VEWNGRNKEKRKSTERWTDKVEEDLKIMGITNCYAVTRDRKEWGIFYWLPKLTTTAVLDNKREKNEEE